MTYQELEKLLKLNGNLTIKSITTTTNITMKTPKQILNDHPEIAKANFTTSDLGYLYRLGIVEGTRIVREILLNEKQVVKWFKNRLK